MCLLRYVARRKLSLTLPNTMIKWMSKFKAYIFGQCNDKYCLGEKACSSRSVLLSLRLVCWFQVIDSSVSEKSLLLVVIT